MVALACAAGTAWLGWVGVPCVGFVYGMLEWRMAARGTAASVGAVIAWAGLLGSELARGADVRVVATQIGAVMQVPGALLVVVTLVFGALLAGTAAVLGAGIRGAFARSP